MNLHFSDQNSFVNSNDKPMIFLAGPSPRDASVADWRDDAFVLFKEMGFDGTLFVPRPSGGHIDSYDGQVEWELEHLDMAHTIMFWVPRKFPEMKGLTTNVEAGLYVKSGRMIYGRPDNAEQVRYLDHIYRKFTGLNPSNSLKTTIDAAIVMAKRSC